MIRLSRPWSGVLLMLLAIVVAAPQGWTEQNAIEESKPKEMERSIARIKDTIRPQQGEIQEESSAVQWQRNSEQSLSGAGVRMLRALGLCIAVFLIVMSLLKRRKTQGAASSNGERMQVVERLAVDTKTSLLLIEVDGDPLIMALGAQGFAFYSGKRRESVVEDYAELICEENEQGEI